MRRTLIASTTIGLVLAVAPPGLADCAAPTLLLGHPVARPGEVLLVRGEAFAAECNDTGIGCLPRRRSPPIRDVEVQLRSRGSVVSSVVVDADAGFSFEVELPVPADAAPGAYTVGAPLDSPTLGSPAPVQVEIVPVR